MKSQTTHFFEKEHSEDKSILGLCKDDFVIVITGRCGSTWLTNLLEKSKACGRVDEFFNESFIKYQLVKSNKFTINSYINMLREDFGYKNGIGFQIDPMRLAWLQEFPTMQYQNLFASVGTVIYMTRRDIVSQAYSFARAKASGHWHNVSLESNKELNIDADYVPDSIIWEEILSLLHDEFWAEQVFKQSNTNPFRITYEDLVTDPYQLVSKVLLFVGRHPTDLIHIGEFKSNDNKKISYQSRDKVLIDFWRRNLNVILKTLELREKNSPLKEYFSLLESNDISYRQERVRWFAVPS